MRKGKVLKLLLIFGALVIVSKKIKASVGGVGMVMSDNGLDKLVKREGVVLSVYKDSAGLDTIGVGHLITRTEKKTGVIGIAGYPIKYRDGISKVQAMAILRGDLKRFENAVQRMVTVDIEQHQFDALVSFAFNVGVSAFGRSTLLRKLNAGKFDEIPREFRKWKKAGGKVQRGLIVRRESEILQFTGVA